MAIQTRLIDDLDGNADGVRTRPFGLDGAHYEIDLTDDNFAKLRTALAPFIDAARRTQTKPTTPTKTTPAAAAGLDNTVVRAWWIANQDIEDLPEPNSHGRVPATVVAAYRRLH